MPVTKGENEALIQAGLNLIQQALSIYDRDLTLAASNRAFREMFALPLRLVTPGASFEDTVRFLAENGEYGQVDDVESFVRDRVETARAFEPHYMERTRANGRTISVEGSPLPQGGWVTVYTDITAIRRQEELLRSRSEELSEKVIANAEELARANRELAATIAALEEAKRELTEMESRTRLTTEMMPAHIAHLDPTERYDFTNRRLSSVLPGAPSDVLGLDIRSALGPSFPRIEPALRRALGGEANVVEFTDELSSRRIRAAFTPDGAGGIYILSMDVTEEAQARAALAQARRRELAAQLTSGLAHDFSNLLTIILGMQSRLAAMDLGSDAGEMIAATRSAARRGGHLLDRLAAISGKRDLRPVPLHLPSLVADILTIARPSIPDRVRLSHDVEGLDGLVEIDPGMLQDSLLNLILNARDAIGPGEGTISLALRRIEDIWIEITVKDTGSGFSDTALAHALDPFFTTKGGEGSGLGLSMVYDMATLSGGHLRIGNWEGGALASLRLPYRPSVQPARDGGLVLLVEDNDDIRASVRAMLIDLGYSVIEATHVDEALELADLPGIDAVLTDITLIGEKTGLDLADTLSARPGAPAVCLMTALGPDDPLRRAAASRFPVLGKPFGEAILARVLSDRRAA
jgi:signal transduction histidine kinase